jgi:hypothetical protein
VIADLQLRIVDFTCTMSLLTGEKTHILTLEGDGLTFDAVVSSSTAERLLGTPAEEEEEASPPSSPRPEPREHQYDEEQG